MVFKRKVYDKLLEWKELSAGTSAVLLEGARRIGKSTIVEEFAKREYDDYMILDFAKENKDIKQLVSTTMEKIDGIESDISNIKKDLLNPYLSTTDIANKYKVSRDTVSDINQGKRYKDENEKYPIRTFYPKRGSKKPVSTILESEE